MKKDGDHDNHGNGGSTMKKSYWSSLCSKDLQSHTKFFTTPARKEASTHVDLA